MSLGEVGPYTLVKSLGKGAMGEVFLAYDHPLRRWVAIKLLPDELSADESRLARFKDEAIIQSKFAHPNITTVYTWLEEGRRSYLVMELVDGESLDVLLTKTDRLTLGDQVYIFTEVLRGVDFAHRHGVVHRDLKPPNVMVTRDWGVKIMDFGIARELQTVRQTRSGMMIGTPAYMAPELFDGAEASPQSDFYALGVTLFEMLTGRVPFQSESVLELMKLHAYEAPPDLSTLRPDLPDSVVLGVARALSKNASVRYENAEEWLWELMPVIQANDRSAHAPITHAAAATADLKPPERQTLHTSSMSEITLIRDKRHMPILLGSACVAVVALLAIGLALRQGSMSESTGSKAPTTTATSGIDMAPPVASTDLSKQKADLQLTGLLNLADGALGRAADDHRSYVTSFQHGKKDAAMRASAEASAKEAIDDLSQAVQLSITASLSLTDDERAWIASDRALAKAFLGEDFVEDMKAAHGLVPVIKDIKRQEAIKTTTETLAKMQSRSGSRKQPIWP